MIDDTIRGWDDARAIRVLTAFARARLRGGGVGETAWTRGLDGALRAEFPDEVGDGATAAVSAGELARRALLVLADDPQNREVLAALGEGAPAESFLTIDAGDVALVTAALVVLQTHVIIERDKAGRVRLKIEKKPTKDGLLKSLVEALRRFRPPS